MERRTTAWNVGQRRLVCSRMRRAGNFALLALLALVLAAAPAGGSFLQLLGATLMLAFVAALAVAAIRLWRRHRVEIESLPTRQRLVLYGSLGLAAWTIAATSRLLDLGGGGLLLWLALLGGSCYGLVWVWTRYRTLS